MSTLKNDRKLMIDVSFSKYVMMRMKTFIVNTTESIFGECTVFSILKLLKCLKQFARVEFYAFKNLFVSML